MSQSEPVENPLMETLYYLKEEAKPTLETFATGDSRDDIARYGLCLLLEVSELINALPWKRWSRNPPDIAAAKNEFADMLCFIGSVVGLFETLGVNSRELTEAYLTKIQENRERFAKYRVELETNPPADAEGEKETKS